MKTVLIEPSFDYLDNDDIIKSSGGYKMYPPLFLF